MRIPERYHDLIRKITVDEHPTWCHYEAWEARFAKNRKLAAIVASIRKELGSSFTRMHLVKLYQKANISHETKFIATMIWGHEAPKGSKRDPRGPWKVEKMFSDVRATTAVLANISLKNTKDIARSYRVLNGIERCGPSFLTKHLYFLGKAQGLEGYPLIFDDRVARGLLKVSLRSSHCLTIVKSGAVKSVPAYLKYLEFAHREAQRIRCDPEQIEYFLFKHAAA